MRWLVAAIVAGCTPPPPAVPMPVAAPKKLLSFAQPIHYALSAAAVARYNEPLPPATTTPFDDAVIAATRAIADPHLVRAVGDVVAIASPDAPIDANALELAWSSAGIIEPPPKLVVLRATDPQAVIAAIGEVPAGSHLGIARRDDLVVVAVTTPRMTTAPFARSSPITGELTIDAKLAPRYARVEIDVAWDDHSILTLGPDVVSHAFVAKIGCQNRAGVGRVVISAIDHSTSIVLARFPIWCGIEPPHEVLLDPLLDASGDTDNVKAAHRMFLLLQRDRVTAGLEALAWDERAATAAVEHAEDLRDGIRAGIPPKFRKTTFTVPRVVSNMITATTVDDAYAKIMAQPGPRANAMSAEMTAGGIGVAGDHDELYVSEVFVSVPVTRDPTTLAIVIERAIEASDRSIKGDPELSSIAAEIAVAMRAGGDRQAVDWILYARSGQLVRYSKYYFAAVTTLDPGSVSPASLVNHPNVDHIGIGVAQGHSPSLGDNALWIVSVQAQRVIPN